MEGPLLTKSSNNIDDDITIHGDSSSNGGHIVDITINDDSSSSAYNELTPVLEDVQPTNPFANGSVWILAEFVVSLVQIVAAIVVLTLTKDEQYPQKIFITLIIGYTCGCIVTLPILCCRFWDYNRSFTSETRKVMQNLKKMLEYFFVGWITVLLWHLIANSSSLDYTKQDFWLCLAFLAISCIIHVAPNFLCALMCFLFPLLLRLTNVSDFVDDIDEKIMIGGLAIFACIEVLMCICTCRLSSLYPLFCVIVIVILSSLT